jgi:tetratricopeptide (TPR) repeat protein
MPNMNRTRFVIAGLQRSGTTVTVGCLSGHPEIACARGEIKAFPLFTRGLATFSYGHETYPIRKEGLAALFDAVSMIGAAPEVRANGLKVALGTPTEAMDVVAALREYLPETKIILIWRDDLVAQYGSLLRAQQTGQWHLFRGDGVKQTKNDAVHIDKQPFLDYLQACRSIMGHLDTLRETHEVHDFHYENDIVPGDQYGRLFEFLGASVRPVTWLSMRKVAPPPEQLIDNYTKARAWMEGAPAPAKDALRRDQHERHVELAQDENTFFLLDRAWNHLEQGRRNEASIDVKAALDRDKEPNLVVQGQARLWVTLEESTAAGEQHPQIEVLRERHAGNPEFLVYRAAARLQLGRAEPAFADLLTALERPAELGQLQRYAFKELERAVAGLPNREAFEADLEGLASKLGANPHYLLFRATQRLESGAAADAHADVLAALLAASDNDAMLLGPAFSMLQQAWNALGDDAVATQALETLQERYGNSPFYLLRRASWNHGRGSHAEAQSGCVAALAQANLEPSLERWAFEMLANALQAMNDPEAARATLRSLESAYPDNTNFLFLRGVVLHALGESSDGVACLCRVLELSPDHQRAGELLQLWRG